MNLVNMKQPNPNETMLYREMESYVHGELDLGDSCGVMSADLGQALYREMVRTNTMHPSDDDLLGIMRGLLEDMTAMFDITPRTV